MSTLPIKEKKVGEGNSEEHVIFKTRGAGGVGAEEDQMMTRSKTRGFRPTNPLSSSVFRRGGRAEGSLQLCQRRVNRSEGRLGREGARKEREMGSGSWWFAPPTSSDPLSFPPFPSLLLQLSWMGAQACPRAPWPLKIYILFEGREGGAGLFRVPSSEGERSPPGGRPLESPFPTSSVLALHWELLADSPSR